MLTQSEKETINQNITAIESQSMGELAAVICQQSDEYLYIPTLWAALLALISPSFWLWFNLDISVGLSVSSQLLIFALFAFIFRLPAIKMQLVPEAVKTRRASRYAHQLFLLKGVHLTDNNLGVMLFVSEAERYVEIIADKALEGKVSQQQWQAIVDNFTEQMQQGRIAQGYEQAIEACGALLIEHFPLSAKGEKNADQLPNRLLEI